MNTVQVRNLTIGEGRPKICVPIVGKTEDEIAAEAKNILALPADLVEWRVDFFENVTDAQAVVQMAEKLRFILGERPLLFTFRTKQEGGERNIEWNAYTALLEQAAKSGVVDLVDVEVFFAAEKTAELIRNLQADGVKVIASNHHFHETPSKEQILSILKTMQQMGADIPKLAVMPQKKEDVLTLLSATMEMTERYANRPIITMSMGKDGVVSRLCGTLTGSAVTFGSAQKASAPGQIPAAELLHILEVL
ncbi:MAG: type I 3-dehydroquinate dehydratase [Lachnospiraceae bacterium]